MVKTQTSVLAVYCKNNRIYNIVSTDSLNMRLLAYWN